MESDHGTPKGPALPDRLGELIGARYRLTSPLGRGGMGVVYEAIDEQLHRRVAIKLLPPEFSGHADRLARFKNEARALASVDNPHILTIYEVGDAGTAPFIATELVEGQTLRERLRSGPLALREALDVMSQVARALAAAHDKRIVHRDIKPENVMIRRDGYVKVLDFGLAGLRAPAPSDRSAVSLDDFETVATLVTGTPAYMSPEQIEGAPADVRSDIFSLGVVLCEAVTGTNPFSRPSLAETLHAIGQTPAPAAAATTDCPATIRDLIQKTLHRDEAQRYQTAADLARDLQSLLGSLDATRSAGIVRAPARYVILAALAIAAAASIATMAYRRSEHRHWVREEATPLIARLARERRAAAAFPTIQRAEAYLPGDRDLDAAIASAVRIVSIQSTPPEAVVEAKDYLAPDEPWLRLGVTPLEHVRIPSGYLRWRISKPGVGESVSAPVTAPSMSFDLAAAVNAPAGMVPVEGGVWADSLAFLGWVGPYPLPPFFVDRLEVSNRQYQEFVDQGGYSNRQYWTQPFSRDGKELTWDQAMTLFRDSTGRPGPATWEAGHFPKGSDDVPVTGVSWFEAAAYAAFSGKSLPVLAQSYKLAPPSLDSYVVQVSNLSGRPVRGGQLQGMGAYGTFDLIGNVREWSWNSTTDHLRFLLGRQASSYGPEALSPFDRSPLNGFRCVRNTAPMPPEAMASRDLLKRNFAVARPVADTTFRIFRSLYAYDKTPLHAQVEPVAAASEDWTEQKITLDAGYGHERFTAYLFLPKNTKPPLQTVVFFPSARVNFLSSSANLGDLSFVDYVVKSGRAVLYPIYQGLYERHATLPALPGPALARELIVDWSKDLGRSIDYLEERSDIDTSRLGYLGVSQGTAYGVILTALESRLKAVVFLDGGFFQHEHPAPGLDQVDFAPRLTRPVLMVNGRYDATFPVESSQLPLFGMLGTPAADKRHVVFDTPHDVRLERADLVREVLAWYDKYLGPVR